MVHVERNPPESLRNGRSRGPSPNGHAGGSPDSSDDDCELIENIMHLLPHMNENATMDTDSFVLFLFVFVFGVILDFSNQK